MESIANMLPAFKPPVLTEERRKEIAEWHKNEQRRVRLARLERSHIPRIYRSADLALCDKKIQEYPYLLDADPDTSLVIRGDVGRGKTYSACAILISRIEQNTVRFSTMLDILREIRGTFNGVDTEATVLGRYANVRLLVIDDLGKESKTDWALSEMFQIIDDRHRRGKPTIYTTQYRGTDLIKRLAKNGDDGTAEAIVSRLGACKPVILTGTDRRIRR